MKYILIIGQEIFVPHFPSFPDIQINDTQPAVFSLAPLDSSFLVLEISFDFSISRTE
jgi:hypothetical protein